MRTENTDIAERDGCFYKKVAEDLWYSISFHSILVASDTSEGFNFSFSIELWVTVFILNLSTRVRGTVERSQSVVTN